VKASNSDGRWSDEVTTLLITIRPLFWQTTWFLALLTLALIAGTVLYIRHHTKRLLLEKDKLERIVHERTERIEEQNYKMRQQAETLREINADLTRKSEVVEGQKLELEDQLQGLQFGADDYISKPFNLDILKAKVHNAIETRRKIRSLFTSQSEIPEVSVNSESLDDKFLAKAYDVLEKYYSNPDFSVEMFSDNMFVTRSLLYKKLKALVDLSPNDFITIYRLKKARPLILSKEMSVSEVAYSVGFNDPKYFSRVFKKFFKKTPSEYLE